MKRYRGDIRRGDSNGGALGKRVSTKCFSFCLVFLFRSLLTVTTSYYYHYYYYYTYIYIYLYCYGQREIERSDSHILLDGIIYI